MWLAYYHTYGIFFTSKLQNISSKNLRRLSCYKYLFNLDIMIKVKFISKYYRLFP